MPSNVYRPQNSLTRGVTNGIASLNNKFKWHPRLGNAQELFNFF